MNHFFALTLPDEARQQTATYCRRWRDLLGPAFPARWHDPDDYHITLKFLGDVDVARQEELIAAAQPVAVRVQPFSVFLAGPYAFPSPRFVNVLIRYAHPSDEMLALRHALDDALIPGGFAPEGRPFAPHVTVARCTRRPRALAFPPAEADERMFAEFPVDRFVFMRTTPPETRQKDHPIRYNVVHTFPFGDPHS